ncbi:MAG: transglutaminase family protein [Akkermansiaceae bacterium]
MAGTKLQVIHKTIFTYASPVVDSVNTIHLQPRPFQYQKTISSTVRVMPPTRMQCFSDLLQNVTHHFEIPEPHTRLEIDSRLRVQNLPLNLPEDNLQASLEDLIDPEIKERTWLYLQDSHLVQHHPEIWRLAIDLTQGSTSIYEQAMLMMTWIHKNFEYKPGSTLVDTSMINAFSMKKGVCQDFAHVMLGLCRAVGIPARYASGYLYNGPADQLLGAQASHAWIEVYLPYVGWIGFDPTNNTLADDRYVKVAVGRDYLDVTPVKGAYRGTSDAQMEVIVEVEKIK